MQSCRLPKALEHAGSVQGVDLQATSPGIPVDHSGNDYQYSRSTTPLHVQWQFGYGLVRVADQERVYYSVLTGAAVADEGHVATARGGGDRTQAVDRTNLP